MALPPSNVLAGGALSADTVDTRVGGASRLSATIGASKFGNGVDDIGIADIDRFATSGGACAPTNPTLAEWLKQVGVFVCGSHSCVRSADFGHGVC